MKILVRQLIPRGYVKKKGGLHEMKDLNTLSSDLDWNQWNHQPSGHPSMNSAWFISIFPHEVTPRILNSVQKN